MTLRSFAVWLFVVSAVDISASETLWLETERFQTHGGWTADAQFIDQMSPYLLMRQRKRLMDAFISSSATSTTSL